MKAKTVNENYPWGAQYDPRAPWNEPEDDSQYELELDDNELIITRKYNFSAEDEWDEDEGYIDPENFDLFAAKKLGVNAEEKWEDEDYLEINDIEDMPGRKQRFLFKTTWGEFEASMDELVNLSDLF